MIEIELFYRIVEAEIREVHADYLKGVKNEVLPLDLPEVTPLPSDEEFDKLPRRERRRLERRHRKEMKERKRAERHPLIPVDVRLLKGFNAGMESALHVLKKEFESFDKRMKREGESS